MVAEANLQKIWSRKLCLENPCRGSWGCGRGSIAKAVAEGLNNFLLILKEKKPKLIWRNDPLILRTRLSRLAVYHRALSGASCHFDWHDESWFVDCCNKETKSRKCKRHCSFQSRIQAPSHCHTSACNGPIPYQNMMTCPMGLALAQSQFWAKASFTEHGPQLQLHRLSKCLLTRYTPWGYWTFAFSGCQWLRL